MTSQREAIAQMVGVPGESQVPSDNGLCCNFEAPLAGWVVIWPDLEVITHHARR